MTSPNDFQQQIGAMYDEVRKMMEHATRTSEEIRRENFTAESADGMISSTVSGVGEITALEIHVLAKRRLDRHTLGEAVTEAVRGAEEKFRARQQDMFSQFKINGRTFADLMTDPAACVPDLGQWNSR